MNKIISYSLWGINPRYLIGAIRNVELCQKIYPEFKCRFYCDQLVPYSIISQLESLGAEIVQVQEIGDFRGMFWRFMAVNEEDVVLIRDADSRPSMRERYAVDEWLKSDKLFHTIKDHPFHSPYKLMPGLSGFKKNSICDMKNLIENFSKEDVYGTDYRFFDTIWSCIQNHIMIHDGIYGGEYKLAKREKLEFCGKIFDSKEQTVRDHEHALRIFLDSRENNFYVYHHLGLGDSLDCNAMVRILLKQGNYDRIYIIAKEKYAFMVEYMYRDNPQIVVVPIKASTYEEEYQNAKTVVNGNKCLIVGHENYPWGKEKEMNMACAEIFYAQAGMPFERRFDDWYFERDLKEEERVFNKLNPNNEEYIFVHDDKERGFAIDDQKVFDIYGKRAKIVRNDMSENLFYFCKILENASQIHVMESAFKSLIEVLDIKGKCYFHNFREGASSLLGKTKQKWEEVK